MFVKWYVYLNIVKKYFDLSGIFVQNFSSEENILKIFLLQIFYATF